MDLARELFGEVLPFRVDPRRRHIVVKGGLAHGDNFLEADRVTLYPTDDGRPQARVGYSSQIPAALHSPDQGSAIWFHMDAGLELRITLPDRFSYEFGVKMLSAPYFLLNDTGRPSPIHPITRTLPGFSTALSRSPMLGGGLRMSTPTCINGDFQSATCLNFPSSRNQRFAV